MFFASLGFSMTCLVFVNEGVGVVPTPDGVWHRDSHYWRKFIGGGVHKIQILIRELSEECSRNLPSCERKAVQ